MSVLVKFSYVEDAHKYVLGIKGDTFEEDLDVLTYYHAAGAVNNDYYIKDVYDRLDKEIRGEDSDSQIVSAHEIDRAEFCAVSGKTVTPSGQPYGEAIVEAYVHPSDEPLSDDSNDFYRTPAEVTRTTDLGNFVLFLRRNKRFVVKVPQLGFKLWFMVPDEDDLELKDADGTPLEIYQPF